LTRRTLKLAARLLTVTNFRSSRIGALSNDAIAVRVKAHRVDSGLTHS
jgi:hypothetical protein